MATDPFDDLLQLEDDYFQQGHAAGVDDGCHAGMVEGITFGIEKGYEKGLELGRLEGRAKVWESRTSTRRTTTRTDGAPPATSVSSSPRTPAELVTLARVVQSLSPYPENARLRRHLEALRATTRHDTLARDNSDDAVTEFDGRVAKARARAKVIANIVGDAQTAPTGATCSATGIEDATGLHART